MMAESEHTPGPWIVTGVSMNTGNFSVGMKEHRIVIAEVTNAASFGDMLAGAMRRGGGKLEQSDCHTQFANARLIAAAPDLLEALKALRVQALQSDLNSPAHEWGTEALGLAHAAIAKAEGRA